MRVKDIVESKPTTTEPRITLDCAVIFGSRWPHIVLMRAAVESGSLAPKFQRAIRNRILPVVLAKCDEHPLSVSEEFTGGVVRGQSHYKWGGRSEKGRVRFLTWQSLCDAYVRTLDGIIAESEVAKVAQHE